jgi:AcrR family transcriptional regulator
MKNANRNVKNARPLRPSKTREAILNAAERLFARRNIGSVSVREITSAANVNVSAVNYYFGAKQDLVKAVFLRRLGPLDERRLQLLDAAESEAMNHGQFPTLETVLRAMIQPMVEQGWGGHRRRPFLQLMGRCFSETDSKVELLLRQHAEKARKRFETALLRAEPALSTKTELQWKMHFMVGTLHHSLLVCGRVNQKNMQGSRCFNTEEYMRQLILFLSAGFRALFHSH